MLTAMPVSECRMHGHECWALVNGGQVLPLSASPGVRWRALYQNKRWQLILASAGVLNASPGILNASPGILNASPGVLNTSPGVVTPVPEHSIHWQVPARVWLQSHSCF